MLVVAQDVTEREKIEEDPSDPAYLVTVRGAGYKFNTQPVVKREVVMA